MGTPQMALAAGRPNNAVGVALHVWQHLVSLQAALPSSSFHRGTDSQITITAESSGFPSNSSSSAIFLQRTVHCPSPFMGGVSNLAAISLGVGDGQGVACGGGGLKGWVARRWKYHIPPLLSNDHKNRPLTRRGVVRHVPAIRGHQVHAALFSPPRPLGALVVHRLEENIENCFRAAPLLNLWLSAIAP